MESVRWQIPSLFNNDLPALVLMETLTRVYEDCPYIPIDSAYGSMESKWNGGRNTIRKFDSEDFNYFVNYYNSFAISCAMTFSNYHITEDDLYSENENEVLETLSVFEDNIAIVSSDLLYDYISSKYPNVLLESSVLKPVYEHPDYDETPDYYNDLAERFSKVVVRPEWLVNDDFMKELYPKEKFVLMVNQTCVPCCEKARDHYDFYVGMGIDPHCSKVYMDTCSIDYYRMRELIEMGFTEFKLQGRNITSSDFLNMLCSYVFEPTGDIQTVLHYVRKKMNSVYKV